MSVTKTHQSHKVGPASGQFEDCRRAIELMTEGLSSMSADTEKAAISIGDALSQIVTTATNGNLEVKKTLRGILGSKKKSKSKSQSRDEGVSEIVERQIDIVTAIVGSANAFFAAQMEIAEKATRACDIINAAVKNVETLTKTSNMLSINLRIEASRLNEEEADGFTALGAEVQQFAKELSVATDRISSATDLLGDSVPRMKKATAEVNDKMATMSEGFDQEVNRVRSRIGLMTESLASAMDTTETRNNLILEKSYEILSSLSFQDPLAQGMKRINDDLNQLLKVIDGEEATFNVIEQEKNEQSGQQPGEVKMF